MRRFLLCAILLALLLLLARGVDSARANPSTHVSAAAPLLVAMGDLPLDTRDRAAFFDHRTRPEGSRRTGRDGPDLEARGNAPARVGDRIRFRYRDRHYERVWVAGTFTDWTRLPLRIDTDDESWEAQIEVKPGRHRYHFVVELEDGRQRERTDRANPRRRRDPDHGWVSEIEVDRAGRIVEASEEGERRHDRRREDYDLDLVESLELQYQRVDGWLLSAHPRFDSESAWNPVLEGEVGYGFKSERWSTRVTFLQPLNAAGTWRLVLSGHDRTAYTDRTGVGDVENTLSTLLFREDNRDWFRQEGLRVGVEGETPHGLLARLEMRVDEYASLERVVRAGWGGREDFLANPEIDEGLMRSLFAQVRLGSDVRHLWLAWELSDDALLSTGFDFQQLTAQGRTRLQMGRGQYLDLRVRFGTSLGGTLPRQKQYLLGGIGTVRGYRYQSLLRTEGARAPLPLGGQRMALFNAEYALGVDDEVHVALFFDSGMAYAEEDAAIDPSTWRSSLGLGVFTGDFGDDVDLRLDLIKPLDEPSRDFMVQGRLKRMF